MEEESPLNPKKALGQASALYERAKSEFTRKQLAATNMSRPRTKAEGRRVMSGNSPRQRPATRQVQRLDRKAIKEQLQDKLVSIQITEPEK
jgi:hypothetical protein